MFESMDIEFYKFLWTIVVAVIPAIARKIWTSLAEGVLVKEYYNLDTVFILAETEVIGAFLVHLFTTIVSVVLNNISTDGIPILRNYVIYWTALSVAYIIIIIVIVAKKTEQGKKRYISNVLFAMAVNIVLGIDLFVTYSDNYKSAYTMIAITVVIVIFVWQVKVNVESEEIKKVEYKVRTKNRVMPYVVQKKPIKSGKYFYISFMDKNNEERKRIQIPESEIEEIEYSIKKFDRK